MASSCKNKTPDTVISWVPARAGACILDRRGQRAEARGQATRTYQDPPAPTRTYRGPTVRLPRGYRRPTEEKLQIPLLRQKHYGGQASFKHQTPKARAAGRGKLVALIWLDGGRRARKSKVGAK